MKEKRSGSGGCEIFFAALFCFGRSSRKGFQPDPAVQFKGLSANRSNTAKNKNMISDREIVQEISNSRILVVGGGGFIGRALIKKLVSVGARVVNLSRRKKMDDGPDYGVETLNSNVCNRVDLKKVLAGRSFEYVFNAAGYIDHSSYLEGGREVVDVHYTGVLNLLNQVFTPSLNKVVQIGSSDECSNAVSSEGKYVDSTAYRQG